MLPARDETFRKSGSQRNMELIRGISLDLEALRLANPEMADSKVLQSTFGKCQRFITDSSALVVAIDRTVESSTELINRIRLKANSEWLVNPIEALYENLASTPRNESLMLSINRQVKELSLAQDNARQAQNGTATALNISH